jgi:metal-responsive CopG/Arc/MetJ family transcriptional regulator
MTQTEILHMRVAPDLISALDRLRKQEADLPSRSEMVRRLIERADAAIVAKERGKR